MKMNDSYLTEEYIGRKRVIVEKVEHMRLDGIISTYVRTGVLNFPEEQPGTQFWVKKTEDGFVMNRFDNGGQIRCTRKSSIQTVISVGKVADESTDYKCYKTDDGYVFRKIPCIYGVGNGKNVVYIHKDNRNGYYFCLPIEALRRLKIKKGEYLKVTTSISQDFNIKIEKTTEKEPTVNTVCKKVSCVLYDGRNKTLFICKRANRFLENCETLSLKKIRGKIVLQRGECK